MIQDWRPLIVKMVEVRQAIDEADRERIWEYHWPRVGASEAQLSTVEQHLGFRLDLEYRTFLSAADGWPWFSQSVCLFGTNELFGSPMLLAANEMLDVCAPYLTECCGIARSSVFPVAASAIDKDVFFMQVRGGVLMPPLVWLAGEEVDRFESFGEFFASMIKYSQLDLQSLLKEGGSEGKA